MDIFVIILRWIAFLPGALIGYIVGTWCVFFGISYGLPEVSHSVRYASDFGGHLIFGPLIVFIWFSVATGTATYIGISIAPSHRKVAAGILGAGLVIFLGTGVVGMMISSDQSLFKWQVILRNAIQIIAMVFGFVYGVLLASVQESIRREA
jgi:hypothetical protein